MTRDNSFRLALVVLFLALALLVAKNALAQVSLEVWPKAVVPSFKALTFHVRWRIVPHADNRSFTLTCDCGEEYSSTRQLEGEDAAKTYDRYLELLVTGTCLFTICVMRVGGKKFCAKFVPIQPEVPP